MSYTKYPPLVVYNKVSCSSIYLTTTAVIAIIPSSKFRSISSALNSSHQSLPQPFRSFRDIYLHMLSATLILKDVNSLKNWTGQLSTCIYRLKAPLCPKIESNAIINTLSNTFVYRKQFLFIYLFVYMHTTYMHGSTDW